MHKNNYIQITATYKGRICETISKTLLWKYEYDKSGGRDVNDDDDDSVYYQTSSHELLAVYSENLVTKSNNKLIKHYATLLQQVSK